MTRTRILLGSMIILLLSSCKINQPLQPGLINYKDKTFKISADSVNVGDKFIKYMFIHEKDGKYIDSLPPNAKPYFKLLPIAKNEVVFDETKITEIVKNVLRHKLDKLHKQREYLGLSFYFDKDGSIGMILMSAKKPSIISIKEIYQIQANLKQEIKATFKGKAWKDYGVIERGMPDVEF